MTSCNKMSSVSMAVPFVVTFVSSFASEAKCSRGTKLVSTSKRHDFARLSFDTNQK